MELPQKCKIHYILKGICSVYLKYTGGKEWLIFQVLGNLKRQAQIIS